MSETEDRREALERFIGAVDVPVDQPFDIDTAREQIADELVARQRRLSEDFSKGSASDSDSSDEGSTGQDAPEGLAESV